MTKEEMLAKLQAIGTLEDDVQRRTLITEIVEDVNGIYDSNATLTEANAQFEKDNESLRSANMQLFLKIGGGTKTEPIDKVGEEKKEPELKFENLFNEKGELK